jgi:hypothetical protein
MTLELLLLDNGSESDFNAVVDRIAGGDYLLYKQVFGLEDTATLVNEIADMDTSAATDLRHAIGMFLASSGGAVPWQGDATNGARVDAIRVPAAAGTTDGVSSGLRTDVVVYQPGGVGTAYVEVPVKYAKITASASGATSIVTAVTGKRIKPLDWEISTSAAVNVKWQGGSTDLTGLYYFGANGGISSSGSARGKIEPTAVTTALNINLSDAIPVGGTLSYCELLP